MISTVRAILPLAATPLSRVQPSGFGDTFGHDAGVALA